jgi:hypothetical protein
LWSNWWNEDWQGETEVLGENLPQRHFVQKEGISKSNHPIQNPLLLVTEP